MPYCYPVQQNTSQIPTKLYQCILKVQSSKSFSKILFSVYVQLNYILKADKNYVRYEFGTFSDEHL